MRRLVTSQRLDEGLWSSADGSQRYCMLFATMLLGFALLMLWGNEALLYAEIRELDHARSTVRELPCNGGISESSIGASVVHLTGCKVTGLAVFTSDFPGLEFLGGFDEVLPEGGPRGVFFKVHLREYSRRRSSGWEKVDAIGNLHESTAFSPSPRIGVYEGVSQVFAHLPVSVVPLRPNLRFQDEVGVFSSAEPPYSLENMLVDGNHLYTSTSDPRSPYDGDVEMWFTVADSTDVSVIARGQSKHKLVPWTLRYSDDIDFTRAVAGSVAARPMIDGIESEVSKDAWEQRCLGILFCWFGTWLLIFPAYALDCCKQSSHHIVEDFGSFCRALPVSLLPSIIVIAMSWGAQRSCLLTVCAASGLLVVCLLLASGSNPFSASSDSLRNLISAPGLLQRWPSAQWPTGMRPTTGSRVRVRASGLEGSIVRDDRSDIPYKVLLDGGTTDWYKERDVLPVAQSPPPEAEEPRPQGLEEAPVRQRVCEAASPLLPPGSVEGSTARVTPLPHSLRMVALGMALGSAVSLVGAVVLIFSPVW